MRFKIYDPTRWFFHLFILHYNFFPIWVPPCLQFLTSNASFLKFSNIPPKPPPTNTSLSLIASSMQESYDSLYFIYILNAEDNFFFADTNRSSSLATNLVCVIGIVSNDKANSQLYSMSRGPRYTMDAGVVQLSVFIFLCIFVSGNLIVPSTLLCIWYDILLSPLLCCASGSSYLRNVNH